MFKIFLLSTILITSALAGIPSVESLFKNGNNKEIATNGISVAFRIKRFNPDPKVTQEDSSEKTELERLPEEYYVKIYFYEEKENLERFLQLTYSESSMKEDRLAEYIYLPNVLKRSLWETESNVEKSLFNSVLMSLLLNKSEPLISFLKSNDQRFYKNSDLINYEKKKLLERYKEYLEKVDQRKDDEHNLISPLKPESEEDKERVKKILTSSMYRDPSVVKLTKDGDRFFWLINLNNFYAEFDNEKRRLKKLKYQAGNGYLEMESNSHVLFNGIHELPKYISLRLDSNLVFQVEFLSLRHFNWSPNSFRKVLRNTRETMEKKEMMVNPNIKRLLF